MPNVLFVLLMVGLWMLRPSPASPPHLARSGADEQWGSTGGTVVEVGRNREPFGA